MEYRTIEADGLTFRIPAGIPQEPTAYGKAVFDLIKDRENWKLPTGEFVTDDEEKANEVCYALEFYLGGCHTRRDGANIHIMSMGYYFHVGA